MKGLWDFKMPCKALIQIATEAKLAGIGSINVSRLAERDEIHVDPLLGNVEESEHELEICLTRLVDFDQSTVGGHTLELSEKAEEMMDARHD
jgi:hypothetical protein